MRTLCNILWHIPFCGFLFSFYFAVVGLILCCTIVLLPLGLTHFEVARFLLAPFSRSMVTRSDLRYLGRSGSGIVMQTFSLLLRILYLPFGILNTLMALCTIVGEALTLVGIPSAVIWAKLLTTIWNPMNKVCVSREEADLIARRKVE